jgi:hypothetical protein
VDEAALCDGLRERGLNAWLEQYLADTPPIDEADRLLRKREALLAGGGVSLSRSDRRKNARRASDLLIAAIAKTPGDPRWLRGRIELARDYLERHDPQAFESLLLYELPGRSREAAAKLSSDARRVLEELKVAIDGAWRSLEALDETELARVRGSGPVRQLEGIACRAAMMRAWVTLYEGLASADAKQRQELAVRLLEDISRAGWLDVAAGQESQRCNALILATVASRLAQRFEEADRCARQLVSLVQSSAAAIGAPARQAAFLAVLEQVRAMRDAGKLDDALAAARQAQAWAARNRAEESSAAIAVALLESHIQARQQSASSQPAHGLPLWTAIAPLEPLLGDTVSVRSSVYEVFGSCIEGSQTPPGSDRGLQLWAGAAVSAGEQGELDADVLKQVQTRLKSRLALDTSQPGEANAANAPELAYLLGRAGELLGDHAGAVRAMTTVAQRWPTCDRAAAASRSAVVISQAWLKAASGPEASAARDAFIQSVRIWAKATPDAPQAQRLQFYLAAALEENKRYGEAADEYGRVEPSDANAGRAALGRARCLRHLMGAQSASQPSTAPGDAQQVLAAAEQALSVVQASPEKDACLIAEAGVSLANLLNAGVHRPAEALRVLDRVREPCQACTTWRPAALRERMEANRQLGDWTAARLTWEEYLALKREDAPALGSSLLEANRRAVLQALDANDPVATAAAEQGALLAQTLLESMKSSQSAAEPTLARAWLLVQAGKPGDALPLFDSCGTDSGTVAPACRLGRAECLLALDRAGDALPIYTSLLSMLPEHSSEWWEAYVGTLRCHQRLKADPSQVLQSIRQQRRLAPELGGPRWRRMLEQIEVSLSRQ